MGNFKFLPFLLLFLGFTTISTAQSTVGASIYSPITLTETAKLEFGTIISSATSNGTVTIASANSVATYVTVLPYSSLGSPIPSAAKFNITGAPNAPYTIILPSIMNLGLNGATTETINGTLTVTDIETNLLGAASTGSLSLPTSGIAILLLGGKLNVGANQESGRYSGTYAVSVAYN